MVLLLFWLGLQLLRLEHVEAPLVIGLAVGFVIACSPARQVSLTVIDQVLVTLTKVITAGEHLRIGREVALFEVDVRVDYLVIAEVSACGCLNLTVAADDAIALERHLCAFRKNGCLSMKRT